jgi:hypothetical protein
MTHARTKEDDICTATVGAQRARRAKRGSLCVDVGLKEEKGDDDAVYCKPNEFNGSSEYAIRLWY